MEVEQILETRTEQIEHHRVVITLSTKPPDEGYSDATGQSLVNLRLVLELRMLRFDGLELDGDLLARDGVNAEVDVAWTPRKRG